LIQSLLSDLPQQQAELPPHRSSDLINVLLVGTQDEIDAAFRAAGWTGENRHSALALYRMYHSLVQRMGYSMAPMSRLTFNGLPPGRSYQKSLDTLTKRHHIRLWQQGSTSFWLGAASEDIGLTIRRMHPTHAIDDEIDNERAKVINDLWFTGCADEATLLPRKVLRPIAEQNTPISTDGDVAVLRLKHCNAALTFQTAPVTAHMRTVQGLRALEDDVLRANPLTVGVTIARSVRGIMRPKSRTYGNLDRERRPSVIDKSSEELACLYSATHACSAPAR
jgi:hypothetical protein